MGCAASKVEPSHGGAGAAGAPPRPLAQLPNVYFVPEAALKRLKYLPRRGCNERFVHEVTGRGNDTVHQPIAFFEGKKVCFVFISHRWLRPGNGARGTPDDDDNSKCKLILAALEKLRGPNAPVPEDVEFAIWLDYSCMDQDAAPGSELQELHSIVAACDLMLTPIVDKDHTKWDFPTPLPPAGWLEAYKAPAWEEYWSRGWVRAHARRPERSRARGGPSPALTVRCGRARWRSAASRRCSARPTRRTMPRRAPRSFAVRCARRCSRGAGRTPSLATRRWGGMCRRAS